MSQCSYCQSDITGIKIKCVECADFDLCLQCFSCAAEVGSHKKDHDYRVASDQAIAIFDIPNVWTLEEENMLLDAVEQYGLGNWEDVSLHVETRTPQDCELHFNTFYIQGNIGKATFPTHRRSVIKDHSCPEGGPLSPSITTPIMPIEISLQDQHDLGYMPLRDDFEREYDNEAECVMSSLAINYDDEDIDIAIKLSQVDKYRLRLKERERRKRIARDYGLIVSATTTNTKQKPQPKKKLSKDEREFQDRARPVCQLHSHAEHEQFFENLQKEKDIKSKIKELIRIRKHGMTREEELEDFEDEKYKREKRKENKKKLVNSSLGKRTSMVSKKAEGKLDILIDDDDLKDEEDDDEDSKEMALYPGYDMLSEREKKLCNSIGMTPANYITIKTCIIKDYLQRRQGHSVKIRYPSGLDKTHRRKIIGFLTDNGWIGVT